MVTLLFDKTGSISTCILKSCNQSINKQNKQLHLGLNVLVKTLLMNNVERVNNTVGIHNLDKRHTII